MNGYNYSLVQNYEEVGLFIVIRIISSRPSFRGSSVVSHGLVFINYDREKLDSRDPPYIIRPMCLMSVIGNTFSNLLCLNPSKTEFILIGIGDELKKIPDPSISLNLDSASTHTFTPTSPVRSLGVIFDQNLCFSDHITQLSRSWFMHIRDLRRIRPMLDLKTASTIATSIVHAKLDYCNSLFLNIDVTQINRLQAIQNALARAVTKTPKHHHITPILKKLHWLKIPQRIEYKVISLTYNTLQSSQPSYLRQLFTIQPPR